MSPRNDLLLLSGKILTLLMQIFMAIGAAALVVTLPFVTLFSGDLAKGFADASEIPIQDIPTLPLAGVLLIGLAIVSALFLFFGRLRAIINTVSEGDPFAPANSERLSQMAWLLVAVQLLVLPAIPLAIQLGEFAKQFGEDANIEVNSGFDLSGILMIIILFILARVFRHGAAMREDLEGTV
jgi:hypothetical protein